MTLPDIPATATLTSDAATPCFLCASAGQPCTVAEVTGVLKGARIEDRNGVPTPVLGLVAHDSGDPVRINLLPNNREDRALVEQLAAIPAEMLQEKQIVVRCWHFAQGQANAPIPGKQPHRVLNALPGSLVIIEPDLLMNITDLSNGDYCVRQELLRQLYPGPPNAAGVRGTLIHNIFKEMLKDSRTNPAALLEAALHTDVVKLAEVRATENEVRADIEPHLASLDTWRNKQTQGLWKTQPRIRAETFLLAPEIGLKGRLDILWEDELTQGVIELKTGRATGDLPKPSHCWQVNGYHALLAARQTPAKKRAHKATLLYSGTPHHAQACLVPNRPELIRRVLHIRNILALVRITGEVPHPPGGNKCLKCSVRANCGETSQLLGWRMPPGDAPLPLNEQDAAWFRHWFTLQRLEGRMSDKESVTLWQLTPDERIASGAALGNLTLIKPRKKTDLLSAPTEDAQLRSLPVEETANHEWIYRFTCDNTSELREGDQILLSDGDPIKGEVVSGAILKVNALGLEVWAREELPWLALDVNKDYETEAQRRESITTLADRYSADVVNQRMLHNLTRWLHLDDRRRELVRGDKRPQFAADQPPMNTAVLQGLNSEQADAVVRAMGMKDYLLIQGPPGTGKTKVIAAIAQAMVGRGYRVALAAFTNQATDNMLTRVVQSGVTNVLRLGHELAIAPDLRSFRLIEQTEARIKDRDRTSEDVQATLRSVPLVAATVATWSAEAHEVDESMPIFDVVILDEATQLTLPATLGALRWAKRFILVGDEKQLPPLVQSEAARVNGLGTSLFETLARLHPDACVALRRQYRMHEAISAFPSARFYAGKLQADDAVKHATLSIVPVDHLAILDPALPLVWVDVQPTSTTTKVNDAEAHAAADYVRALVASGMAPGAIGVIAPFRGQVAHIRQLVGDLVEMGLTIDTVDRFQGGERAAIILSLVAAVPPLADSQLARFLGDPNRLNVALTRARHKLIILGHRPALAQMPILRDLAAHCERAGCVVQWDGLQGK